MNNLEVVLLKSGGNDDQATHYHRCLTALGARISQRGQEVHTAEDLVPLLKAPTDSALERFVNLPHPELQRFGTIEVVIIGGSRRFLSQITRHRDCHFMSSSFRYANHSSDADFVIPIEVIRARKQQHFKQTCFDAFHAYKEACQEYSHDAAGYLLPMATRGTLLISATPFQWKHMISQRTCQRAGSEIRYIMLRIWNLLYREDPVFFSPQTTGPMCLQPQGCREGGMSCNKGVQATPSEILRADFPELIDDREDDE
jgi:thymidylate synthase (FAD)